MSKILSEERLIRWAEVKSKTGVCRSDAHAKAARGEFPKPIKIGRRASAWLLSEVEAWVRQRIAESRPESFEQNESLEDDDAVVDAEAAA